MKLGWDDAIPEAIKKEFVEWQHSLKVIREYEVERWAKWAPGQQVQIHVMSLDMVPEHGSGQYLPMALFE